MRRVLLGVATAIAGLSMLVKILLGAAVHLLTVSIAYNLSGMFAAFLTFVFPGVSQMVWIAIIWHSTGTFWNLLTAACAAYVVSIVVMIFAASLAAAASDRVAPRRAVAEYGVVVPTTTIKGLDEKFCFECGAVIRAKAEICVKCGCRQPGVPAYMSEPTPQVATGRRWISGQPHPWRRYFARMLDSTTNGAIISFLIGIIFYISSPDDAQRFLEVVGQNRILDIMMTLMFAIPLNATLTGFTGGTLGKWLFGIRVHGSNGKPIGLGAALHREVMVWFKGMGLGIPIVNLFTCASAYRTLTRTGSTSWDKRLAAEILYRPNGFRQIAGTTFGVLAWLSAIGALATLGPQKGQQVARLPRATVQLLNKQQVKVDGPFGIGTADELRRVLDTSQNIRFVELESKIGGYVDEGLTIYDLLRERHLSTFTQDTCVSACTIAYMGGEHRFLGDNASLQFHEWETTTRVRLERDSDMARRLFVAAGVSTYFAARAFAGHDLWVPDRATLIEAGVVTHAMDGRPYR
jgi:uncharacterized RDD family membrane protein YckC